VAFRNTLVERTEKWPGGRVENADDAERLPGLREQVAALRCRFPQLSTAAFARILRVPEDWIEPVHSKETDAHSPR